MLVKYTAMIQENQKKINSDIKQIVSNTWVEITSKEFTLLRDFVYNNIGINLTEQKRNLVMGRLQKILRREKFTSFQQYYDFVASDKTGRALSELANSISTNHTFFYRERDHFDFFYDKALPETAERLKKAKDSDLRIWSAGCSSGEEPYTLVMLMMEFFGSDYYRWDAGVLATDISERALEIARKGVYGEDRVKNLPPHFVKKYFNKLPGGDYEVTEKVKKEVTYRRFNLMNERFPFKKQFHSIFCRNVMIYFDDPTRRTLVDKFYNLTAPQGYFFIGHSESLKRDEHKFKYIMPALYKKV